jgi:hypothetical protein
MLHGIQHPLLVWLALASEQPGAVSSGAAHPTGPCQGMLESMRAAEDALMASTSGSMLPSADSTVETICTVVQ